MFHFADGKRTGHVPQCSEELLSLAEGSVGQFGK